MLINLREKKEGPKDSNLLKPIPPRGNDLFLTMKLKGKEASNDSSYKQLKLD